MSCFLYDIPFYQECLFCAAKIKSEARNLQQENTKIKPRAAGLHFCVDLAAQASRSVPGDWKIPLGLLSAWSRGSAATSGWPSLPRGTGWSPIQIVNTLVLHKCSAALIALALRSAVWRGREGGVHWVWSLFRYLSHVLMWVTIKMETRSFWEFKQKNC